MPLPTFWDTRCANLSGSASASSSTRTTRPPRRFSRDELISGLVGAYRAERRYLRSDGAPVWVLASAAALVDDKAGSVRHLTVQLIDIDRQKRAEAELKETADRWTEALEAAGQGIWDHDFRRGTVFYSKTWRSIRGIAPDEPVDESRRSVARPRPPRRPLAGDRDHGSTRTMAKFHTMPSSTASCIATGTMSGSSAAAARSNGFPTGGRRACSAPTPTSPA